MTGYRLVCELNSLAEMKTLIIAKRARTRAENSSPQFLVRRTARTAIGRYWSATGAKLDRFKEVDTSATFQFVGN